MKNLCNLLVLEFKTNLTPRRHEVKIRASGIFQNFCRIHNVVIIHLHKSLFSSFATRCSKTTKSNVCAVKSFFVLINLVKINYSLFNLNHKKGFLVDHLEILLFTLDSSSNSTLRLPTRIILETRLFVPRCWRTFFPVSPVAPRIRVAFPSALAILKGLQKWFNISVIGDHLNISRMSLFKFHLLSLLQKITVGQFK